MRRSELLGLRWGHVDLESSRLGVNRALVSVAYELHDSPGKTRSSRRSVDLDARTLEVLRAWRDERRLEAGRPIGEEDRVVAHPDGEPIHPDSGHPTPGFTMATYQHVLPGMQADAARIFANLLSSTGFNPVEGSVEALTDAEKPRPEASSDLDFLVAGGGFEPPTFGL